MAANAKITVIVPVYNEEDSIEETLTRLSKVQEELTNLEIIVVDDGSTDSTFLKTKHFRGVKCVRHNTNMGKGAAVYTGLQNATGEVIVIQDADLEYSPERIPELITPIVKGEADVVFGTRFGNGVPDGMSLSHFLGNRMLSIVASFIYGVNVTDIMTGYKAFRRTVLKSIRFKNNGFAIEIELTAEAIGNGWKYKEISLDYCYRKRGKSKIRGRDGLICFSKLLLGGRRTIPASVTPESLLRVD